MAECSSQTVAWQTTMFMPGEKKEREVCLLFWADLRPGRAHDRGDASGVRSDLSRRTPRFFGEGSCGGRRERRRRTGLRDGRAERRLDGVTSRSK